MLAQFLCFSLKAKPERSLMLFDISLESVDGFSKFKWHLDAEEILQILSIIDF